MSERRSPICMRRLFCALQYKMVMELASVCFVMIIQHMGEATVRCKDELDAVDAQAYCLGQARKYTHFCHHEKKFDCEIIGNE